MEKKEAEMQLPILEEMLSVMETQQQLRVEITEELRQSNQDLMQAQRVIVEQEQEIASFKELVTLLNDEHEKLMKL